MKKFKKSNFYKILVRGLKTSIMPLVIFLVCYIATSIIGNPIIGEASFVGDITQILKLSFSITLMAVALSINLFSGRFDFSLGATMLLCSVISAKICTMFNLPFIMVLVFSVLAGTLAGALSGTAYVVFKLPPLVMSLIMTLVYEGFGYIISSGKTISTTDRGYDKGGALWILAIVFTVAILILIVIFNYTKFGYNYRSLKHGQNVSVATGINEKVNAIICYTISGALIGVCSFFSIMNSGGPIPVGNFQSVGSVFVCFFAVFIGAYLSKWCEQNISYFLGGLSYAIISQFFSKSNIPKVWMPVLSSLIMLIFVIYLSNEEKLSKLFLVKGGIKNIFKENKEKRRLKKLILVNEKIEAKELFNSINGIGGENE
jgi:ribose transport system permease protein